ncbi:Hsp70 suppressor, GTPase facilitates ribosomal subunit dissociation [Pseudocyphellaria aurata]|nr:Hsp70 suppressor, GTPase facilitates ribosomal subunit dissociation [Pseudocyphellaria aurata]
MSRHKLVKTLNLDDELDDYDGGANYDQVGDAGDGQGECYEIVWAKKIRVESSPIELSAHDKQQLQDGTAEVRSILGSEAGTDEEIQESLWHYYYDVEKTVNYILNQKTPQPKKSKKKKEVASANVPNGRHDSFSSIYFKSLRWPPTWSDAQKREHCVEAAGSLGVWNIPALSKACSFRFSAAEFFKDAPWLDIPKDRCGEILIEPLYPPGRLLGGCPLQGGRVSKLAALAAARKKKDQERNQDALSQTSTTTSVALLDRLSGKNSTKNPLEETVQPDPELSVSASGSIAQSPESQNQSNSPRKRKSSSMLFKREIETADAQSLPTPDTASPKLKLARVALFAPPSVFAKAVFGMTGNPAGERPSKRIKMMFTLPQVPRSYTENNPFAEPSPDDIVRNAQNLKGPKANKSKSQPQNDDGSVKNVTHGISKVTLDATPRTKSKNLNIATEFENSRMKNGASFVVIGHVDAGKSTLMGRLLYDLKVVDQRTIDRYRKEAESIGKSSFTFAWVLDQGTEERNRGVTIDIATNKFETEKTKFTILDAPGHRDFIPNMIAGASQADFAVLVIDASTGSFESGLKGQTKEHALLVRSIGVARLIVAVNKLDTVDWSEDRFLEISTQVSAFLTAAGFLAKNVAFVPCSGLTGENIVQPSQNRLLSSWYQGLPLLSLLDASEPMIRAVQKPLRLTINDIFRGSVTHPLSVSGRLDAGNIQVGDIVLAMPSSETAFVKAIEVDSEPADWAVAGQNATLHLADIESKFLKAGDVICSPAAPVKNTSTLTSKILAFSHVMPMHVEVHRGRLQTAGRITRLVALLDKSSGSVVKKHPRLINPGSVARVVLELDEAVPLETPGRIILRAGGDTIAAGLLE